MKQGNESLFISPRRREEDDTLCTDLTKKSTVYVEIIFCFYLIFIKTALHKTSLFSGKKKKKRAKQAKTGERSTNSDTNYSIFTVHFRTLCTLLQLEDSHVKKINVLISNKVSFLLMSICVNPINFTHLHKARDEQTS